MLGMGFVEAVAWILGDGGEPGEGGKLLRGAKFSKPAEKVEKVEKVEPDPVDPWEASTGPAPLSAFAGILHRQGRPVAEPDARYQYVSADGRLCCEDLRWDATATHRKIIRPTRNQEPTLDDLSGARVPLFGAQHVAGMGSVIWVHEGAKCALLAFGAELDSVATRGSSHVPVAAELECLRGRDVVLCRDEDANGTKWTTKMAAALDGIASRVAVWSVGSGLPAGSDFEEWQARELAEGRDPKTEAERIGAELLAVAGWAPAREPKPWRFGPAWPVEPVFPEVLQNLVSAESRRLDVPPEMVAVPLVVALGSAIGRRCGIRPKVKDDWLVIPNLWGLTAAAPGSRKSDAADAGFSALRRLEADEIAIHNGGAATRKAGMRAITARIAHAESMIDASVEAGESGAEVEAALAQAEAEAEEARAEDTEPRRLIGDCTFAKIGDMLAENRYGLVQEVDELLGLLRPLSESSRSDERGGRLAFWSGTKTVPFDRISRDARAVEGVCVGLFGTSQTDAFLEYCDDAVNAGDGFIQRLQVVCFPEPRPRKLVDFEPDQEARAAVDEAFRRAAGGPAVTPDSLNGVHYLRFSAPAQEIFNRWQQENIDATARAARESPAWSSHLDKFGSLVASLALSFHLAEHGQPASGPTPPVSAEAVTLAVRLSGWLAEHGRLLYRSKLDGSKGDALRLYRLIECGLIEDGDTLREVYRKHFRGWKGDRLRTAMAELELCNVARLETISATGKGRPSDVVRVNPDV